MQFSSASMAPVGNWTPDDMPLLWALRDKLDLARTKYCCGSASAAPALRWSTAHRCSPAKPPPRADHDHRGPVTGRRSPGTAGLA
jgi:hypothetical protein